MNSKNKVLIGCLALLLVLSVGYALFSDTITINGTASAKGSFDITATCEPGISSKLGTAESLGLAAAGGYETNTCLVTDDSVTFSTSFLYPGSVSYSTVKFTNTGTIDASLSKDNIVNGEGEFCYAWNKEGENLNCIDNAPGANDGNTFMGINSAYDMIAGEDADGNLITGDAIYEYYDPTTETMIIPPNCSFYMIIKTDMTHFCIDSSTCINEFFLSHTTTTDFLFEQVTE